MAFAVVVTLVMFQILSIGGCPPLCVADGGFCTFNNPTKCCTPLCLAQYGVCGKDCTREHSACTLDSECCTPLPCNSESKTCCAKTKLNLKSPCNFDSECCSQKCLLRTVEKICCVASGDKRVGANNCCTSRFNTDLQICCSPAPSSCTSDLECCSTKCVLGKCQ